MLSEAYQVGKKIGRKSLNSDKFHSRLLCIAYGILNEMPPWQNLPDAKTIGDLVGTPNGLSFAFMNFSKFSNDTERWQFNPPVILAEHQTATKGGTFIEDEIAILQPDYVVGMCLEKLGDGLDEALGRYTKLDNLNGVGCWWLDSGKHRSLYIDSWHFAAGRKDSEQDFYAPICEAIRRYGMP